MNKTIRRERDGISHTFRYEWCVNIMFPRSGTFTLFSSLEILSLCGGLWPLADGSEAPCSTSITSQSRPVKCTWLTHVCEITRGLEGKHGSCSTFVKQCTHTSLLRYVIQHPTVSVRFCSNILWYCFTSQVWICFVCQHVGAAHMAGERRGHSILSLSQLGMPRIINHDITPKEFITHHVQHLSCWKWFH